jgi:hypothetical protein
VLTISGLAFIAARGASKIHAKNAPNANVSKGNNQGVLRNTLRSLLEI